MEVGTLASLKRVSNNQQIDFSKQEFHVDAHKLDSEATSGDAADLENGHLPPHLLANDHSCKMFEIARCFPESGLSKVYLVYRMKPDAEPPTLWLHREDINRWCHLADNFTVYFRMMLVHLGLPLWQCCVAGLSLPTWVEQVYFLLGPHLLPSAVEPTETISTSMWNNGPTNVIDTAIFKGRESKQKSSRKK
ncbi:Tubulin polyglutamylase complex subunit 2 [Anthophora quadrimaculata]